MALIRASDLRAALRDLRRTLPQMALADLLARAIAVLVAAPVVGSLLELFSSRTDDGVLTDADIALFLLHPIGLFALLVVGGITLATLFLDVGVLHVIAFGALEDRRITWLDGFAYVARRALQLWRLAVRFLLQMALMALPFLAAIGGLYLWLLGDHDINYYLSQKPPGFLSALALAAVLSAGLGLWLLVRFSGWVLALTLVLFEGVSGRAALKASEEVTRGHRGEIAAWLAAWVAAVSLLLLVSNSIVGLAGRILVPEVGGSLRLMATGIAVTLVLTLLVNLATAVLTTALFPLLLLRLYRRLAGPGRLTLEDAEPGSLGEKATLRIPGWRYLVAVAALLLLVLAAAIWHSMRIDAGDEVEIIAHRGAAAAAPENTLAAFERAIEDGADWIELDVQESAEGVVLVAHDSDFMRVAGLPLKVWEATEETLADVDIGGWFAPAFADQRAPTLRQALELAKGRAGVVIELKYYGHDERLEERVVEVVEAAGMVGQVQIMSLKLDGLRKAVALRPAWRAGLLNTAAVGDLTTLDLDFLALNAAAASRAMVHRAHERGLQVYAWTVNNPVQMSVMISRGVDGLITDEPALAAEVIELRERLTPFGRLVVRVAGETGLLRGSRHSSSSEDA